MKTLALCTAGLLMAMSAPASAEVIKTTFTGAIGDAQGNLTVTPFGVVTPGQSYTLVYTIDSQTFGATLTNGAYGQKITGTGSVTAALTINGLTRTIGGQSVSQAENKSGEPDSGRLFDRVGRSAQDFSVVGGLYSDAYAQTSVGSYLSDFLSNGSFTTPFTYTPVSADSYLSSVHFNVRDFTTNTQITNLYLNLGPGTVTNEVLTGAAPEPDTWALMILGFGAAGVAMRRSRKKVTVAYA